MTSLLPTSPITREQAIERYTALVKKRRDISRKNLMLQTRIAQFVRKNNIKLASTKCSLENMTAEEEKIEYEKLLKDLKDLTSDQIKESADFSEELSHIESHRFKLESNIEKTEGKFEEIKSKILKSARNSQTNLPIHPKIITAFQKQESYKDNELRKLRIYNTREQNKLEELTIKKIDNKKKDFIIKDLCSNMVMENDLYCEQVERREETNLNIMKHTARNYVMISHGNMKLHFISTDVQRLENEENILREKLTRLRDNLLSCKDKLRLLEAEKTDLEDKEMLLTNTKLLKDYQETSQLLSLVGEKNEKLRKCLGHWWEGLQKKD